MNSELTDAFQQRFVNYADQGGCHLRVTELAERSEHTLAGAKTSKLVQNPVRPPSIMFVVFSFTTTV